MVQLFIPFETVILYRHDKLWFLLDYSGNKIAWLKISVVISQRRKWMLLSENNAMRLKYCFDIRRRPRETLPRFRLRQKQRFPIYFIFLGGFFKVLFFRNSMLFNPPSSSPESQPAYYWAHPSDSSDNTVRLNCAIWSFFVKSRNFQNCPKNESETPVPNWPTTGADAAVLLSCIFRTQCKF